MNRNEVDGFNAEARYRGGGPAGLTRSWWIALAGTVLLLCSAGCRRELEPPTIPVSALDSSLASGIRDARARVLRSSHSAVAWGKLGQACEAAGFLDEARICYARAVEFDPGSVRWLYLLALLELATAPDAALDHLGRAARLAGTNTDAPRLRWSQALSERGRFADAARELAPLLGDRPGHPAARLELARIRLAGNQPSECVELLAPCLTNPYTARPALLLIAQARQRMGDAEGANAAAHQAAAMPRPFDWPDPFLREVQALRKDRRRLAEQANTLLMKNRLAEAGKVLEGLLAGMPDDAEGLLVLGRLRLQQRRCPEAEAVLRRHLQQRPDSLNGLVQLGLSLLCQTRPAEAAVAFERAVALKPDFAQAHFNLGTARSGTGDHEGAVRAFREALRCNPGDASVHAALGDLHLRAGEIKEARRELGLALKLDSAQPRARALTEKLPP